jgi:ABC-2 type transport system permease protein
MRGFFAVYRKELYRLFASPIFYVVAFIFLALVGYFFYSSVAYYSLLSFQAGTNPFLSQQLNLTDMVLEPFFGSISIVLLLMVPLITMRLFAEEKKTGTAELLFTYPISDGGAVLGKFIAGVTVLLLLLLGTFPAMLLLEILTSPPWATILGAYVGLFLMSSAFVSLGLLASSLTENQIIAAAIAFGALLLIWWVLRSAVFSSISRCLHITTVLPKEFWIPETCFSIFFLFYFFCSLRCGSWNLVNGGGSLR